jgi:hypothetical protein
VDPDLHHHNFRAALGAGLSSAGRRTYVLRTRRRLRASDPAGPAADAWIALGTAGVGGIIRYDAIEIDELRFPMLVSVRPLEIDTEGPGRRCGASNVYVELGPTLGDM